MKLIQVILLIIVVVSHPAWVCGLKQMLPLVNQGLVLSHPAWVCGLKPPLRGGKRIVLVTPCVGVWIETIKEENNFVELKSHPAWVCGLKHT